MAKHTFHVGDLVRSRLFGTYATVIGFYGPYSQPYLQILFEDKQKRVIAHSVVRVIHTFMGPVSDEEILDW